MRISHFRDFPLAEWMNDLQITIFTDYHPIFRDHRSLSNIIKQIKKQPENENNVGVPVRAT